MKLMTLLPNSPESQRMISHLDKSGYDHFHATDQKSILELVRTMNFQALVIDDELAEGSLIQQIRNTKTDSYIYIFGLTNKVKFQEKAQHFGGQNQADEYLEKPVEPDELLSRLAIVDRYQSTLFEIRTHHDDADPIRDPLTGAFSQSTILELLTAEVNRANRTNSSFVLALLAIDSAKYKRNELGEAMFDKLLVQIALKIWANVRAYDLIGRWEQHKYLIILPETTMSGASIVAERIVQNIADMPPKLPGERQDKLSTSIGFAQCGHQEFLSITAVISTAENSLEKARIAGGNQIAFI